MSFENIIGRYCVARACIQRREGKHLMCNPHWSLVPQELRERAVRAIEKYEANPRASRRKAALRVAVAAIRIAVERKQRELDRLAVEVYRQANSRCFR